MAFEYHYSSPDFTPKQQEWTERLYQATRSGNIAGIDEAVAHGADIRVELGSGNGSLLHVAQAHNQREAFRHLVERVGVPLDMRTKSGFPVIYIASVDNRIEQVKLLLDYGANPDTECRVPMGISHAPLLHHAMLKERTEIVRALLEAGADPLLKDSTGKTAYETAVGIGGFSTLEPDTLSLLERYQAMPRLPETGGLTHDALFEKNEKGFCLLDNPVIWRQWDEVQARLKEAGEKAPVKSELMQPAKNGKPFLRIAAEAKSLDKAIEGLNLRGDRLGVGEWKSSAALGGEETLSASVAKALFTPNNLRGKGRGYLRGEYEALPEALKSAEWPWHKLQNSADASARVSGRGR